MWHWDQGRLEYFQFDVLRHVAQFALNNDLSTAPRDVLQQAIGLDFAAGPNTPWRNYARIFKSMFLVYVRNGQAIPTPVAAQLAIAGEVTGDEYFHFVVQATTEPSPALSGYRADADMRYPLLFALRYILMKARLGSRRTNFDEIIGAYAASDFIGDEDDIAFLGLRDREADFVAVGKAVAESTRRQARESLLRTICQVSYLHVQPPWIEASIDPSDAEAAFAELTPIGAPFDTDPEQELLRRATFFRDGSTLDFFDYPRTVVSDAVQAGFDEGGRARKSHLVIERNSKLRREYFALFDPRLCDICNLDTRLTYPWTGAVLDLHHKLPLASGTRVETKGTVLTDLVPVCPTCHRATHRYYSRWLSDANRLDFESREQAAHVYDEMKLSFGGHVYGGS